MDDDTDRGGRLLVRPGVPLLVDGLAMAARGRPSARPLRVRHHVMSLYLLNEDRTDVAAGLSPQRSRRRRGPAGWPRARRRGSDEEVLADFYTAFGELVFDVWRRPSARGVPRGAARGAPPRRPARRPRGRHGVRRARRSPCAPSHDGGVALVGERGRHADHRPSTGVAFYGPVLNAIPRGARGGRRLRGRPTPRRVPPVLRAQADPGATPGLHLKEEQMTTHDRRRDGRPLGRHRRPASQDRQPARGARRPDQWDHPSLCDGWTVRHVAAHLTLQQQSVRGRLRLHRPSSEDAAQRDAERDDPRLGGHPGASAVDRGDHRADPRHDRVAAPQRVRHAAGDADGRPRPRPGHRDPTRVWTSRCAPAPSALAATRRWDTRGTWLAWVNRRLPLDDHRFRATDVDWERGQRVGGRRSDRRDPAPAHRTHAALTRLTGEGADVAAGPTATQG